MKNYKFSLLILFIICPLFIGQAFAAKQVLCLAESTGKIIAKRKCNKKQTLLDLKTFATKSAEASTDMSGEWSYTPIDNNNSPGTQKTITLTQTGADFKGSNDSHTIVGRVEGNWVRLTQTVSGEEGEGFVRFAEGSLYVLESGFTLGTLAVVGDTFGDGGALILRRAAPEEDGPSSITS